ncbi:peptidase A24A domain protein [Thermovirga lienii DSM 17291]|jgi:leader peptidase (prepilin peptidase)/N-methyltransferase|uniref:Peptidase A24A domain protein n=1 Tax=Thermovirga lienii (strain ATCC BAA-1197 / DSM 17291 / Cas60314) TaxID=580340 RepID=G7V7D1_THELD|nr:A24 family peptidase [Thermovirga lienii]AER67247.1 peptidase A24A domain protein [Thermovirga lienii DSM 17291]MDN5318182.1 leader peptidase (prepilin peptidase) / N-methyltransferase [Thermovirga sp.]HCD71708.1 prepilin peptidase [Thermovirga lienii]
MKWMLIILSGMIGASMGSFLNVVARRTIENDRWWGNERSRCDHCGHELSFWDLVPLFSYISHGGKCRYCSEPIGASYLIVELTGFLIGAVLAWRWGGSLAALTSLIISYGLLLNALTDIYSGYIYDLFAWIPGVLVFFIRVAFGGPWIALDSLFGALLGAGLIGFIIFLSKGKMGWGDASLMGGTGLALGFKMTALSLYMGFMIGGTVALILLILRKVGRKDAIVFGPFLALGTFVCLVLGPLVLSYLGFDAPWPWSI